MAKCDFCGKSVTFGIQVSHSHRRSNRTWKPNIKRVNTYIHILGQLHKEPVHTIVETKKPQDL